MDFFTDPENLDNADSEFEVSFAATHLENYVFNSLYYDVLRSLREVYNIRIYTSLINAAH